MQVTVGMHADVCRCILQGSTSRAASSTVRPMWAALDVKPPSASNLSEDADMGKETSFRTYYLQICEENVRSAED